jgi:hypothetical protein
MKSNKQKLYFEERKKELWKKNPYIKWFQVDDIDNDETSCIIANLIYEVSMFVMELYTFLFYPDHSNNILSLVGLTITYAISAYHHWCCGFESQSGRGVQYYVIKFVSDLRQVGGFLRVLRFPPSIKDGLYIMYYDFLHVDQKSKMATTAAITFNTIWYENVKIISCSMKLQNYKLAWTKTVHKWSLDNR